MSVDSVPAFVDPRVRVRNALRALVHGDAGWDQPSLSVFRNRLLDLTGSDARPLADLLVEAIRRGWPERMRGTHARLLPLDTGTWDATVAPFIMRWSAERFVLPEMARWAVECWGYAFDVIRADQLRIAPPAAPVAAAVSRAGTAASVAAPAPHAAAGRGARPPAATGPATASSSGSGAGQPRSPQRLTAGAGTGRAAGTGGTRSTGTAARPVSPRGAPTRSVPTHGVHGGGTRHASRWVNRLLTGALLSMGVALVTHVSMTANASPLPSDTPRPLEAPRSAAAAPAGTPAQPGVPAITRDVASRASRDSARMLFVEPARRASGTSRPIATARAGAAVALDEIRLVDGSRMRGRVEIVRAGTVIFRDVSTGLRHEIGKDEVSEIVTEFGTAVRFRDGRVAAPREGIVGSGDRTEPGKNAGAVRTAGVGGRYQVRYAAAIASGSRECTSVWQRAPDAVDRVLVTHRPGADTLTIAFDGGDAFASNVDRDGRFASTFRIVPDQARSSTALTTRLHGRFGRDGMLSMDVNIIFFRRMRAGGDLACNVTVSATGVREP